MARKKNKPMRTNSRASATATLDRWMTLAVAAHERGALGEAATYYAKIVAKDPNKAPIWHTLAGLRYQSGDHQESAQALIQAVEIEPENLDYLNDLGGLYLALGELSSAEGVLRSIVTLRPEFSPARYNLSDVLYQQGRLSDAIAELNKLIALEPEYGAAHFNLGIALRDIGNMRGAIEAFQKALVVQSDNERAYLELARLYADLHYLSESIANYKKYLAIVPRDADTVVALTRTMHRNGQTDEAIQILERFAQNSDPNQSIGICLGEILQNAGRLTDAELTLVSVFEKFPKAPNAAIALSRLRRFADPNDPVIQKLRDSLESTEKDQDAVAPIHFALGKIYDDLGQFDIAFRQYDLGNQITAERLRYDAAAAESETDELLEVFSSSFIGRDVHLASDSEKPLLIVGIPRSGTTLTEQIIASHKDAAGAGELGFFPSLIAQLPRILGSTQSYPGCCGDLDESSIAEIVQQYLELLGRHDPAALRVTDKLPGNYRHVGLLRCLFKNARVIVCRRDPRDVALSVYFQYFRERHEFSWSLSSIAHCIVQHERLVRHWLRVIPDGIIQIEYEDLILNNETTVRRIIEFLGLNWDPNCLNFHTNERDVNTASNWQVRQPLYASSLGRWSHYEPYLKNFENILDKERERYGMLPIHY